MILICGCRRPPKVGKSSLLAEHMHGSSTMLQSKLQQELTSSRREEGDVGPHDADGEQQLFRSAEVAASAGAGDASAIGRSVASACSIESAINSVISQARAETETVAELPDTLPPELTESVNALKDSVC